MITARFLSAAALIAAFLAASVPCPAHAQDFGVRPIRFVVAAGAGGIQDILNRAMATKISEKTGWTTVVENRPGGDFMVATQSVLTSPSDGYSVLNIGVSISILPFTKKDFPLNLQRDLIPLTRYGENLVSISAPASLPVKNVAELLAYGKANPGKLSYGTTGAGGYTHLLFESIKLETGLDATVVPYKDAAPMIIDVVGGRLPLGVTSIGVALPQIRSGAIRPIFVAGSRRSPAIPDVPTAVEGGLPGVQAISWLAYFVRAGTPRDIVERLHREISAATQHPDMASTYQKVDVFPIVESSEAFAKALAADMARWERVVKATGIKVE